MRRLLLTCLFFLLLASAADAATRHIVRGRGFGHGVGMGQYGAFGYAQHGYGYAQILRSYYLDTRLASVGSRRVRVLLQPADPFVRVRGASRAGGRRLRPSRTYTIRRSQGRLSVRSSSGRLVGRFASPVRLYRPGHTVRLLGRALNGVSSGRYRGAMEVLAAGGSVTAVNVLPIDSYVRGVVAGEMPASWDLEALKAQAVAARSYALATAKRGAAFDQYPDTRSQVYRGVVGETPRSNAAVQATAGQILTYAGRPAVTYYHSTSGGHTENVENSFLGSDPKPYLRGVRDPYDGVSPHHRWRRSFTTGQMTARLQGYVLGHFRKIRVLRRGVSPRIVRARIYGTRGNRRISGPTLRARLGLMDTWARFIRISTSQASRRPAAAQLRLPLLSDGGVFQRPRPRVLFGVFDPAPAGMRPVLERRIGDRWKRVAAIRTSLRGRYSVKLRSPGLYRVRSGGDAGPAVRVR